jgi:hypothetical protein
VLNRLSKAFNSPRGSGLGIGAKLQDKERKTAVKTAETMLRKKLVAGKKPDLAASKGSRTVTKPADEDEVAEEKVQKKRKRNAFLDEILAGRKGKK